MTSKKLGKTTLTVAAVLSAAALSSAAAALITTKLLVNTALDRNTPNLMKNSGSRISGSEKDPETAELISNLAAELENTEHETVRISGGNGVTLVGHFFPAENAERIIIAFHGWRSSWAKDYGMISKFWHSQNSSVLYVEQRGQNQSGGEYMGFGLTERFDCITWANWANLRCGNSIPIYLAGISMGATTVLMASDLNLPQNVHGIMADCGFTSPKAIFRFVAKNNLHIGYGIRSIIADYMCKKKINMGLDDHSTLDALSKTNIPVLFVHGTDDHFVPVEMTYENYKACVSKKRLLIVPGADHAMSYLVDKPLYERAVKEFWHDFD